jgi:hypothetical protein
VLSARWMETLDSSGRNRESTDAEADLIDLIKQNWDG